MQVGTCLLLAGIALLSLHAHYRSARVIDDPDLMAGLRHEVVTQAIHPWVERLDDPQRFLDANKGTLWSMRLLGVNLTDPLAAVETVAASKTIHWPLLASVVIPVLIALFLGRVFCSWICPGYLLFELAGKIRGLLRLAEINPAEVRFSHNTKYIVLIVGTLLAAATSAPLFALIYPPAVISRTLHAWIFGTALTGMVVLLGLIIAFEVFVSPRWWCRVICPGGALYGLIGCGRPVRVRLKRASCTGCRACIPVCEAGINPITDSASIECDNCGVCINHCEPAALYYTISVPGWLPQRRRELRVPGSTTARVVLLAGTALLSMATPVAAHHILGLPHYSYKENYPQRPTLEYPATTGPYDVLLTSYPGVPVPGEPANLAFYIKNRQTSRVFAKTINVRVLQTHTFGDNTVILPATARNPFDHEYKFHVTFPMDGEYVVELSIPVEGRTEVIPFLMTAGEPTATASFVAAGSTSLVVLFVALRAIQIKRRRRARLADAPADVVLQSS